MRFNINFARSIFIVIFSTSLFFGVKLFADEIIPMQTKMLLTNKETGESKEVDVTTVNVNEDVTYTLVLENKVTPPGIIVFA